VNIKGELFGIEVVGIVGKLGQKARMDKVPKEKVKERNYMEI